jgi:TetR/AcrR family transcriptional regulator, fatty acid metabolism regulator protein
MSMSGGQQGMKQERSARRRERILDAAFSVFSQRGYRQAGVDEVGRQAETSKGGVYFHFPTKESLFLELLRTTADRLTAKVERSMAPYDDPIERADVALRTVLGVFAGHRTMARLFLIDAVGAGSEFQAELQQLHERFAGIIASQLDDAVAAGTIEPIDTAVAGMAWFGALNEVVVRWLMSEQDGRLEDTYPTLRALLLRSVGIPEERIAALAEA